MQNKITAHFKNSQNSILLIKHNKRDNALYDWHNVRNPFKVMINHSVLQLCNMLPLRLKSFLYGHILGIGIGKNIAICPGATFDNFYPELVSIEDNVIIRMDVKILTHEFTHDYFRFGRVHIGKNALIGAFCTIRSVVKIGKNSMVAMNSFVNKDIPDNELWGGVPAKFIKKLKNKTKQ